MVFVASLFFLKNKSTFKNEVNLEGSSSSGLIYSKEILGNLLNKDTDNDGVLDWEESLWGTDPIKKDTNGDGVEDGMEIEKLKSAVEENSPEEPLSNQGNEKLTETDKFSRELFSTIAALNQTGAMDQTTVDKLSSSLAEHIQNSPQRKVYRLSDIKVINNNDVRAIKTYDATLDSIHKKYPVQGNVISILQKFVIDEENVNLDALNELDPIIEQVNKIIEALVKVNVPELLVPPHLDFINGTQKLIESLEDIKLYEVDVIVALSGISQFEKTVTFLEEVTNKLAEAIKQKLNN